MVVKRFPVIAVACILVSTVAWRDASSKPPASIRLKANAPSCSQVDLQWTDEARVEIGFTIERTGDPSTDSWRVVGTTGPTARTFSDTGLSPFTTFYYRVTAGNAAQRRVSNVVKVKTKQVPPDDSAPTVPASVTAVTGTACNSINVSWTASTDVGRSGLKAYTVYVSGDIPQRIDVSNTSFVVTGLPPSSTQTFAVSATDFAGNESARSETVVASTRATCSGSGGAIRSAAAFSGEGSLGSSANCVSVGPDDSTVIAVGQRGSIDYGEGSLASLGGVDLAIVKFGADGRLLWSRIFGSSGDQSPSGMGIDAQGDIYLTGAFENRMELDDETLESHGPNPDIFLIKLDGANGRSLWARSFGSDGYDKGYALAVDPSDGVVITGYFTGAVDFDDDGTPETAQGADIVIARFASDGRHVWSRAIGGPGADFARAMAMDGAGNVSITGSFEYTVDFGNGHSIESAGGRDIFVASYDRNGVCRWSKGFGDGDDDSGRAVAVDNAGGVVAMGLFVGNLRLDTLTIASSTTGYPEIFLTKFDTNGAVLWAHGCGAGIPQGESALATDRSGEVLTSVASSATVNFGGGPLAASTEDVVVAKLHPDGRHVWSRRFVSLVGRQNSGAIASAPNGDLVLVGLIEGTADYEAEVVTANGPILLRLGP